MKEKIIGTKLKNQECKKKKSKLIIFKPRLIVNKATFFSQQEIKFKFRNAKK